VSSTATRLKIVVTDNGIGFRYSDLQRSNLGVRVAIRRRLEAFGVGVDLDTDKGTTWIFEVKSNA
jgi:signal transduction histidine kinase